MSPHKVGRNEPCWCGSGEKFKRCHYGRDKESALPLQAMAQAARDAGHYKVCMHPAASSQNCGKVISAHTLQRSRVLKEIANSRSRVFSFHPPKMDDRGRFLLQERGWRDASTFTAFCDQHDADLFSPLERQEFSASPEQCFLIAYRAMCWELHRKIAATRSNQALAQVLDRGAPQHIQRLIQNRLKVQQAGFEKGMKDLVESKSEMDTNLLKQDYSSYAIQEFLLERPMLVASTGAITPNLSIGGQPLQTLHDPAARTQWLSFGVDISSRGVSVIFTWKKDEPAPSGYMKEVSNLGDDLIPGFLVQFFFSHCENTYFLDTWWNGLAVEDRLFLEGMMGNSNPYYYPPKYELGRSFGIPPLLVRRTVNL